MEREKSDSSPRPQLIQNHYQQTNQDQARFRVAAECAGTKPVIVATFLVDGLVMAETQLGVNVYTSSISPLP